MIMTLDKDAAESRMQDSERKTEKPTKIDNSQRRTYK